ncbi:MAG: bifunctional folylpolyglutamate synthase/dihydrofolate synthase [Desulfobacterales bacterium]|nr:bifunctional folylpolyglutamate synthase/dihydrofolate synthase [Desulfobacterales bacterium]
MFGLKRFGIKLELSTIQGMLNALGNPEKNYRSIHIAGTNGKGSIASSISSILHKSGYKVGLYTSPHLIHFNERICINNNPITDEEVVSLYNLTKDIPKDYRDPTFFEITTAMALYEFSKEKVDFAVIETGMGGRFDATNIISPIVSIISNISLEHQMYLGNTIAKIAYEKAGIIKKDTPIITGAKQKSAVSVIEEAAQSKNAPIYRLKKDFKVVRNNKSNTFSYYGLNNIWHNVKIALLGDYQIENAAISIAACEIINKNLDKNLSFENIQEGLLATKWPGRLEVVCNSPKVILDGAHNLNGAKNLAKFLSKNIQKEKLTLVIGILNDKPFGSILRCLLPLCKRAILTTPKIDRAVPAKELYAIAKTINGNVKIIEDVGNAVRYASETSNNEDTVCIAGSLYVVGEAKEKFNGKKIEDFFKI